MRIFTAYCCRPRDWQPSWAKPMSPQATRRRLRNCEQRLMPIFLTPAPGLYNVNTGQPGVADQQGNAYAVLYGVAPAPRTNLARLRGFEGYVNRKSFKINPSAYKVFTTEPYLASRPAAVILGGGCSGNSSLICLSRSWRSASGCV